MNENVPMSIKKIRTILISLRASVKRKDVFLPVGKELDRTAVLPIVECETGWSFTL